MRREPRARSAGMGTGWNDRKKISYGNGTDPTERIPFVASFGGNAARNPTPDPEPPSCKSAKPPGG